MFFSHTLKSAAFSAFFFVAFGIAYEVCSDNEINKSGGLEHFRLLETAHVTSRPDRRHIARGA